MYLDFLVKVSTVKGKITRRKKSNVVYIDCKIPKFSVAHHNTFYIFYYCHNRTSSYNQVFFIENSRFSNLSYLSE